MIRQKWILVLLIGVVVQVKSGPESFRLPGNVVPDHYRIKILTDLSDDFFYNGEVCIDFLVNSATNKIVLHSKNLKIFENETRVEEFGKSMMSSNEKILRRPKELSWEDVEFRNGRNAELVIPNISEQTHENERIVAAKKRKQDIVFDRHEIFEKESGESSESSESNEGSSEEKVEKNKFKEGMSGYRKKGSPKPLPSIDMSHLENIQESSTEEKVTLTPVRPQKNRVKYTTTVQTTHEYTRYPDESTQAMTGDKTKPPVKIQNDRMTTEKTQNGYTNYPEKPVTHDKNRHPTKPHYDKNKYSTTEPTNYPTTHRQTHYHTTHKQTNYPTTHEPTNYPTTHRQTNYPTTHKQTHYHTTHKQTNYPTTHEPTNYPTTHRQTHYHTTHKQTNYPTTHEQSNYPTTHKQTKIPEESVHTVSTDKTRPPMMSPHDRTTETVHSSTQHGYTKTPTMHASTQPPRKTQDDKFSTEVTESMDSSTVEHTKTPTTHKTTMDDKIHFMIPTTEAMMPMQHPSTTPKQEDTKGPVETSHPVTHSSVVPPAIGLPHMEDTPVKVPQESFSVLKHEFDTDNNFLVLHLDKPLTVGKKYKLFLNYQGVLTDTLTGFHRVPYLKRGSSRSTWLASTVFEPNEARTAFPCFDEPSFKATFDVTLGHDRKFTALSNMPLKSKTQMEGRPDWQWSEFETTPRMSTYVVAFLISDLEYLTPRVNYSSSSPEVTYRFWSRPDVLYKTRYAMRIAPEMKNYLENQLGVRDVLPKHDFVALPSFISSALENWGLYSFAEKNLLFTPGFSSIFSKYEITHVLAHEIAHMWFGNMVTPKWWDQIWLSEGFSNFFEIIAADHAQPTWDLKSISVIFSYLKVFTFDALHTSHPLVPKLNHPNDLNEIFDSITYQKGFYLVRMLNYTLGEEAFMNGVRKYLKTNLLSNVDEDDLWEALTDSAHQENTLPSEYHLKDIMHSWTRRAGYPIIDVIRDYENNTATVTQRRFLRAKNDYEFRDNSQDLENKQTKWWIPLTYTTGSELNFRDFRPRVWMDPQVDHYVLKDMPSKSDFVLMNLDAAGLYRVNYDQRNWDLIISYLLNENSSDISVVNRVQILDDLLDLARAGEMSYERALDAMSYLAKETHFLPWKAALSNFDFISRMLRLTDSNKSFKKFVRNLVAPRFEELGFESVRNEPLSDGLNRKQIAKWACKTGLRQCTRKSVSLFKKWTEEKKPDEHNPIPSNMRSIVYCTAIENGGSKDWQFLWQRYLSNVVTDKTAILHGLGCSKSTRTLRKYLDWSIKETSGIKKQDTPTVFKSVVRNDVGFNLAKTFLRERMGDIKSYLGDNPFYLPQMIETVAAKMNQPQDLEELEELEQSHFSHLRSIPRSFRQANERVRFNIDWVERNFKPIHDWLKKQRI